MSHRGPPIRPSFAVFALCAWVSASPADAQVPGARATSAATSLAAAAGASVNPGDEHAGPRAEGFVPVSHWSREALRRLAGIGLLDAGEAGDAWPLSRTRVRMLLREAHARAVQEGGAEEALAAGFVRRFARDRRAPTSIRPVHPRGRLEAGWTGRAGRLDGGASHWVEDVGWVYGGPVAVADRSSAFVQATVELGLGRWAGVSVGLREGWARTEADEVYAFLARGGFDVWGGRRALALGPASGPGLVLAGGVPFTGVGIARPEGSMLPGFLAALGPIRPTVLLARLDRSGPVERPWFWAARVGLSPGPGLSIGLNRAAIFGGEGNEPVTLRNVALMLVGLTDQGGKSSDFENQVASADLLWRTGVGGVPLVLHAEWAFDDVGGAWFRVPGVLTAIEVPAVPGAEPLSLVVERVAFSTSGGGNPPWYRHGALAEGWTDRGRLLGHPLGGHGTQWEVRASLDAPGEDARAGGTLRLLRRERRSENLFAPERTGTSVGAALDLGVHGPGDVRFDMALGWERGDSGWRRWDARLAAGMGF